MGDLGSDSGVSEKALPKRMLPGAVVAQYRTVGGKTYGPYWYRFWREQGRLCKAYVSKSEVEEVRTACLAYRADRRLQRENRQFVSGYLFLVDQVIWLTRPENLGERMPSPRKMARYQRVQQFMRTIGIESEDLPAS